MSGDPDRYDEWGCPATTDRRMAWSPVKPADPMDVPLPARYPEEDVAVAGLLRTLQGPRRRCGGLPQDRR